MVMGPTCGMILADLGAEVIKIEPPGGDKTRKLPGLGIGFFRSFNRNKMSVVLDINTPEGLDNAVELIGQCDVLLENFRPGMMEKFGLDYATLSAKIPAPDLRVAQGLPAGTLREPARAGRGGPDDGRALLHDRTGRPAAARRHFGQRHHGRHVRRHRRAVGHPGEAAHRTRPGGAERPLRELRVPLQPAHAAVLDDGRAAAAHAVAGVRLERLRRVHARPRRTAVHRRGERQAVPDAVQRDRPRPTCSTTPAW